VKSKREQQQQQQQKLSQSVAKKSDKSKNSRAYGIWNRSDRIVHRNIPERQQIKFNQSSLRLFNQLTAVQFN